MINKIKILHIITDTNIGGAGVLLLNYLDNCNRDEFEPSILIPEKSLLKEELNKRGIAYREIPYIAEKSLSLAAIGRILKILREIKPDIVHTHASMSGRIGARLYRKCRIIFTRHCVFDVPPYKTKFPYRHINGFINNLFADRIIAISQATKDSIVSMGVNPNKITAMMNGVGQVKELTEEEKKRVRERYGIDREDFVCAVIARLVAVKGHIYILEAFRRLEALYPKLRLVIAGTGEEEENLKKAVVEMGLKNCIFTGFVKAVYEIENIMDLQLNASYGTETSSLSLLEGMSLGIPAVASDFGGNPYLIQNGVNGIIVPKKNADKIYEAVSELISNGERYKILAKNCRKIYKENFTSKKMAENTENVYKEMMK